MTSYLIPQYLPGEGRGIDPATGLEIQEQETVITGFKGATSVRTGSIDLNGTLKLIVGADVNRRTITLQNLGANDIYIGGENVTIDIGFKIAANNQLTLELRGELYGLTAGTVENVRYLLEADV